MKLSRVRALAPPPPGRPRAGRARLVRRSGPAACTQVPAERSERFREGAWTSPRPGFRLLHKVWDPPPDSGPAVPLLVIHGGPGVPHNYLLPLARLAEAAPPPARAGNMGSGGDGSGGDKPASGARPWRPRAVYMYDQLGCGGSDAPGESEAEYSVEASVRELAGVLDCVASDSGVPRCHVLGQSWGGILAYEGVMAGLGERMQSLTLCNTPVDVGALEAAAQTLLDACGGDVATFMARHNCRASPTPEHVTASYAAGATVFRGSGAIAGWSARSESEAAAVWPAGLEALVVSGEHDFVTPDCARPWLERLPARAKPTWELVPGASHMPFNEPDCMPPFMALVGGFLAERDGAAL